MASQEWPVPREIRIAVPRPVRLTTSGIGLLAIAVLVIAGGGAFSVDTAIQGDRHDKEFAARMKRLRTEGAEIEGTVTRLWISNGRFRDHYVVSRYRVGSLVYERQFRISPKHWDGLQVGSAISVRYLPSDPSASFPSADPPREIASWPFPIFLGVILVACGAVLFAMVLRDRNLLVNGRHAPAFVTSWGRASRASASYFAYYEFHLPDGTKCTGSFYAGKDQPTSGTVICILYLPERPRRNAKYPLSLAEVATS
jgi:hypothetical protein